MPPIFHLSDIAHGRSGDKGNHANVAILAYTSAGYSWLQEKLSAETVRYDFTAAPGDPARWHRVPGLVSRPRNA